MSRQPAIARAHYVISRSRPRARAPPRDRRKVEAFGRCAATGDAFASLSRASTTTTTTTTVGVCVYIYT